MYKLFNICSYIGRGMSIPTKYSSKKGEIYQFKYSDIQKNGDILLDDKFRYNVTEEEKAKKLHYIENNDIVFPELVRNNIDLKMIQKSSDKILTYSSRIIYIRVIKEVYSPIFLDILLNSQKFQQRLLQEVYMPSKGCSDVSHLRLENLRNFEIPFISIEQQKDIMKKEKMKLDKINKLKEEINELYNL